MYFDLIYSKTFFTNYLNLITFIDYSTLISCGLSTPTPWMCISIYYQI